jgi:hypothetical protein
MKKAILVFCMLFCLSSSIVFAQSERKVNLIGTIGVGGGFMSTVETLPQISWIFDVNLISKSGFTLNTTNITSYAIGLATPTNTIMFGPGYHFMRAKWNIGTALLSSPAVGELLLAGKINGSYFLTDDIGITGILTYRQTIRGNWDLHMFDAFAGVSIKLF